MRLESTAALSITAGRNPVCRDGVTMANPIHPSAGEAFIRHPIEHD